MINAPTSRVDTPSLSSRHTEGCHRYLGIDLLGLGKVLSKEVAGTGLQRFVILHHRFDRQRLYGSRKRSSGVFEPIVTGIAIQFSAKSA